MLSVEEAQKIILGSVHPLNRIARVPLTQAYNHILAVDAHADTDVPPFTNSSMDGYAVLSRDVSNASDSSPVTLAIDGVIRAGHPQTEPVVPGHCYKIMTGAAVPDTADAVVPTEWTKPGADAGHVQILRPVMPNAHIRPRGEDMVQGQIVISQGSLITPPVLGMLATIGLQPVPIVQAPRVAILATGDELRAPDEPLPLGSIRNSNSYALYGAIVEAGGEPVLYPPVADDPKAINALFQRAAEECDLLVSSGGVSVGDFDFVKSVIEASGHLTLWRVNVKPGKPLAFGDVRGVPIIGLPGNPVSALVTFELFVRPTIRVMLGDSHWPRPCMRLPLAEDYTAVEDRRQYVRCRLLVEAQHLVLKPHLNQGSAVQSSWQDVDALMIVPEHTGPHRAGEELDTLLLSLSHIA
ncbi:MAG: molybdopterin molybdochelatase [Sulfobacillus acidophilus]|uniref:Molybdopterin molybdenumtransferase n=1 Tax=Sulfobacillus acidophilus TaxID=53633 RepID=A0A2T2WGG4_9FIRM|nr:MAG: molybdopterin molybdochelatase [Sulfobacillus acidophilus]